MENLECVGLIYVLARYWRVHEWKHSRLYAQMYNAQQFARWLWDMNMGLKGEVSDSRTDKMAKYLKQVAIECD